MTAYLPTGEGALHSIPAQLYRQWEHDLPNQQKQTLPAKVPHHTLLRLRII
jgi:hypothetical protein